MAIFFSDNSPSNEIFILLFKDHQPLCNGIGLERLLQGDDTGGHVAQGQRVVDEDVGVLGAFQSEEVTRVLGKYLNAPV